MENTAQEVIRLTGIYNTCIDVEKSNKKGLDDLNIQLTDLQNKYALLQNPFDHFNYNPSQAFIVKGQIDALIPKINSAQAIYDASKDATTRAKADLDNAKTALSLAEQTATVNANTTGTVLAQEKQKLNEADAKALQKKIITYTVAGLIAISLIALCFYVYDKYSK